nr:urease accessory protein F [Tanacetum cinerariifolium]
MGDKTVENDCTNHPSSTESDSLLQWSMWQLIDSILPIGGFAHSFGLEAATQSHIDSHPEDLQTYWSELVKRIETTVKFKRYESPSKPFGQLRLDSASLYANSRLDAIIAETLILASDRDQLLPSRQEGERLHRLLPDSKFCIFDDSSYMLFMDKNHDMVTILKATSIYRRIRNVDYV